MPVYKYFKGKGEEVMSRMQKQYGAKKGKEVFQKKVAKKKAKQ